MKIAASIAALLVLASSCYPIKKTSRQTLNLMPADLLGNFADDYGSSYTITNKEWLQGKSIKYHLLQYDKQGNYFIAKNDEANPADGGLYTRIDIIYFENMEPWRWGYCLTAYKAGTANEALNTAAADRANARKGCNGFPFSRMKRTEQN